MGSCSDSKASGRRVIYLLRIFFEFFHISENFIIIPCFVGLIKDKDKTGSIIGLLIGITLLLCSLDVFNFEMAWKLALPVILVLIGLSIIFKNTVNQKDFKIIEKLNQEKDDAICATFSAQSVNFENEKCVECGLNRNDVCSVNTVFNKEAYETNEKLKYMKDILMWIVIGYITSIFLQILFGDFLLNNETKNNFFGILNRFILPITMIFSTIFEWYFTSKYAEKAHKTLRIINYSILIYFNFLMVIITLKIAYIFIFLVAIDIVYGYTLIKNYKNKIVNNSYEKIIILGCIIGALIGLFAPMVSYTYSGYLAIAIIAALDSVFGGIVATLNKNFDLKIFVMH